ncbi:MAG TPA: hypothetical protein VF587_08605 [Solirubrobacteraceae bacterium]
MRPNGTLPSDPTVYDVAFVGAHPGFAGVRTPGEGTICLEPDTDVISVADAFGGVMTDSSGNDTRVYFNGDFGCTEGEEVRVVQKFNSDDSVTNQGFNIVVP